MSESTHNAITSFPAVNPKTTIPFAPVQRTLQNQREEMLITNLLGCNKNSTYSNHISIIDNDKNNQW